MTTNRSAVRALTVNLIATRAVSSEASEERQGTGTPTGTVRGRRASESLGDRCRRRDAGQVSRRPSTVHRRCLPRSEGRSHGSPDRVARAPFRTRCAHASPARSGPVDPDRRRRGIAGRSAAGAVEGYRHRSRVSPRERPAASTAFYQSVFGLARSAKTRITRFCGWAGRAPSSRCARSRRPAEPE